MAERTAHFAARSAEQRDAIVVGGGPAGSACALELARAGVAVALVERQLFPRRKVCGEYLGVGAVETLEGLGHGPLVAKMQPLRGVRIVGPALEPLELHFDAPAVACERAVLDAHLLEAARAAGAELIRAHAEDVAIEGDRATGVVVREPSGERRTLRARFVVGADGAGSLVARKLGLVRRLRGRRRFAVGGHYRGLGSLDRYVEMYVAGGAYAAYNPLDGERTNAMLIVPERELARWSHDVDAGAAAKTAAMTFGRRGFGDGQRIGARASIGPLAFRVRRPSRYGALLIGDAAGFLDPFTGQGVLLALRGGRSAAAAIRCALERSDAEAAAFARYVAEREHEFRFRRRLGRFVGTLLDVPLLARRAARNLRAHPPLAQTLLAAVGGALEPERALNAAFVGKLLR